MVCKHTENLDESKRKIWSLQIRCQAEWKAVVRNQGLKIKGFVQNIGNYCYFSFFLFFFYIHYNFYFIYKNSKRISYLWLVYLDFTLSPCQKLCALGITILHFADFLIAFIVYCWKESQITACTLAVIISTENYHQSKCHQQTTPEQSVQELEKD